MNATATTSARRDLDAEWRERPVPEAFALYQAAGWPVRMSAGQIRMDLGSGWVALVYANPDALAAFVSAFGELPDGPELVIPDGDMLRARLFRSAEARTALDLHGAWPGVSTWGAGRSLLLPPGVLAGAAVKWRRGKTPGEALDLPGLPGWLADVTMDPTVAHRAAAKSGRPSTDAPCTDLGNAERLARRHGRDLRWCEDWGCWLVWAGTHWEKDRTGEVARRAADTAREIAREAADCDHDARRKALLGHAIKSEGAGRLEAMTKLSRSQPGLAVVAEDWDADRWALPCANGTLDLRTGTLRASRREDLSTRSLEAAWTLAAECPRWLRFLEEVQPDPAMRAFLQRWAGYAATGVIREHSFTIHWGTGRNGKSVFMDTLLHVLGAFARQVPTELLIQKQGQAHPAERMVLRGLRLASASETEQGAKLAVALIKQLTGGESVSARGMGENFQEFEATHKLALQTNSKPRITENTAALWMRMCLVAWTVTVPSERQDPALKEKLLAEAPGILRWIVEGCLAWQREGLNPPAAVLAATEEYRRESNPIGDFLDDRCTRDPLPGKDTARVLAKPLYEAFKAWCDDNGRNLVSQKALGDALTALGYQRRPYGGVTSYVGLRLIDPSEHPAADLFDDPSGERGP